MPDEAIPDGIPSAEEKEFAARLGRPQAEIDFKNLRRLGRLHCTYEEVAAFFEVSKRTVVNHFNRNAEAKEIFERGKSNGKISLRRWQFRSARKGNVTAQIWLGKQILDQKDRIANELSGPEGTQLIPPKIIINFVKAKHDDDNTDS